jgi:hypothetical protein
MIRRHAAGVRRNPEETVNGMRRRCWAWRGGLVAASPGIRSPAPAPNRRKHSDFHHRGTEAQRLRCKLAALVKLLFSAPLCLCGENRYRHHKFRPVRGEAIQSPQGDPQPATATPIGCSADLMLASPDIVGPSHVDGATRRPYPQAFPASPGCGLRHRSVAPL